MNKIITTLLVLCALIAPNVLGQRQQSVNYSGLDLSQVDPVTLASHINTKANLFCKYVVDVGSKNKASDEAKRTIITEKVPKLFYDYNGSYMLTSAGRNGSVVRKKKMKTYFNNLLDQSRRPLGSVAYELSFSPILASQVKNTKGWMYKETLPDGSKKYARTIKIFQTYYVFPKLLDPEQDLKYHEEKDTKELEVYLIVTPKNELKVFLGDVTRIKRG